MAHLTVNTFSSYVMTNEEANQSAILTINQKQHIQNELAKSAEEKVRLSYKHLSTEEFLRDVAYSTGMMDALQWILTASDTAEDILKHGFTEEQ